MSVFKDKTPIMCTKGATRDLYSNLMIHKRAITNKANKKSEDYDILRERFKPISKKLKDITNAKKPHQKVDEYSELGSRNSTLSDEQTAQTDGDVEKMPTRASDHDDENGKSEQSSVLPPLYIDIQDEIERNLKIADIKFSKLKKMQA